ncbi:unnamed protein product [Oikopleura dioica]|uniref:C-type lectin domain-containing protein n=1 Tax=Oikopleura dioica TaxID=34765 RepID=E4X2H3_OIKDI|nr:unnamed protein product [Oikopleura dioica]
MAPRARDPRVASSQRINFSASKIFKRFEMKIFIITFFVGTICELRSRLPNRVKTGSEEWSQKYHFELVLEPKKWVDARNYCKNKDMHLVTIDCAEKQRGFSKWLNRHAPQKDIRVWTGLNSREMEWLWQHTQIRPSFDYFRNGYPEIRSNTCVYTDDRRKRTWRGGKCGMKLPFVCETNHYFPEVPATDYNVKIEVNRSLNVAVEIETVFAARSGANDNNDIVSILWLPLAAVITDVSMQKMTTDGLPASNITYAEKTDCTSCDSVFRNIAYDGRVVTRLDKEGVQEDKFRTVRVVTALCGMHNIALKIRYEFPLENGRIEHFLRPGYRTGNFHFELTTPNAKVSTNFEAALDPKFEKHEKYKTMRAEMREPTYVPFINSKSRVSRKKNNFLKTKTHKFSLSLGELEFNYVNNQVPTCP